MSILRDLRRRLRSIASPLLGALIAVYFGYHALTGDRSLISYWRLTQEVEEARAKLAVTKGERERLEHRVTLLRPETIDPDMLDERARWALGYLGDRDVMIVPTEGERPHAARAASRTREARP
jgi:cell division protein FtsB